MPLTRLLLACALLPMVVTAFAPGAAAATPPDRIVVVTFPGVAWEDIAEADTPVLHRIIADGAVAAMAVRSAARTTIPERGYSTLGAGNRTNINAPDPLAHLAFEASRPFENSTAGSVLTLRQGEPPTGEIVHLGAPALAARQDDFAYDARLGRLGSVLRAGGVTRAVVSASDLGPEPGPTDMRRASVLAVMDERGSVDAGRLDGLLIPDPEAPFGVRTDPQAFGDAVAAAVGQARVVLVEPGETLRADEYVPFVAPDRTAVLRRAALERADALLARVLEALGPRDLLLVAAVSKPSAAPKERLTPLVAYGHEVAPGWLTSPSTRREGLATLTDIAPTVLSRLQLDAPAQMSGTPVSVIADTSAGRIAALVELDEASVFRERFSPQVTGAFFGALVALALLAGWVFLGRPHPWGLRALEFVAYLLLAAPPATQVIRLFDVHVLGDVLANLVFWSFAAVLAVAAAAVPGPRWSGAIALFGLSVAAFTADLLAGAPLQLNGVFAYSPIVAGRFYGASNLTHAILYSAGILGFTALADLRGHRRAPLWVAGLFVLPVVVGLPMFGANFGGVLSGIAAVGITYVLARYGRVRWRSVLVAGTVAVLVTLSFVALDLSRPPQVRTHLGRFAETVLEGGLPALGTIVQRKAAANLGILGFIRWSLAVPVALAVVALMLWKPKGVLRESLPRHPLLKWGLVGALVAGVAGFAVNDSGIAISAMVLAHVAPFLVLMGLDTVSGPRAPAPARGREPAEEPSAPLATPRP